MECFYKTVKEILAPFNGGIVYEIPEFQREYSWGKDQWDTLYNDIYENDLGYFIGSIICISGRASDQNGVSKWQVIDGQQRLTTVSILIMALLKGKTPEHISGTYGFNDELENYSAARKMIRYDENKNRESFRLIPQEGNRQDYQYLVAKALDNNENNRPPRFGNRRVSLAYENYRKKIEKLSEQEVFILLEKVLKSTVVSINVEDETKAFLLFEALNNRGLPLSIIDLINTNVVKVSTQQGKKDTVHNHWVNMKKNLGDDPRIQERFLRQYYNAIIRSKLSEKSTKAKRSNLLSLYDIAVKTDCLGLAKDLHEASRIYALISAELQEDEEKTTFKGLHYSNDLLDLKHAEGSTSYTLLLYLIKNQAGFKLSDEELSKIITTLTRFFIIRSLTERPATRALDDIFMRIIDEIKEDSTSISDTIIRVLKENQDVTREEIKKELNKDVYDEYQNVTRFLLAYFETNSDGDKGKDYDRYWARTNKGSLVWTIEHVLPETTGRLPDEWIEMLDPTNKDPNAAKIIQESCMHKIGNLTLTPYNSELSNAPLLKKQTASKEKGGYQTTNLYLNTNMGSEKVVPIKTAKKWTENEINARTEYLVDKFVSILFPIDNRNTK